MKRVIRTGRIGRIVNSIQIGEIGVIIELAFDGQLWTECYWESETENLE